MKACICFLLIGTFAYTNSSRFTTPTKNGRHVNLTLKSVKNKLIETSKTAIVTTDKTVINDNMPQINSTVETFTEFIRELLLTLNSYNDDIFQDFVKILDKEIKKCLYKGKNEFLNQLADKFDFFMAISVSAKRRYIKEIVDTMRLLEIFDRNFKELLDYVNSLYRDEAKEKLAIILTDLKGYSHGYEKSKTIEELGSLIKECVRAIVFFQTDLNAEVRNELRKHIDTFMKKIEKITTIKPTVSKSKTNTVKISKNISAKDKTTKASVTKPTEHLNKENKTGRQENKIFRTNTKQAKLTTKTSTKDKSVSHQKNITISSQSLTVTEIPFYKTTEKPGIVYISESKSKLVERMLKKEATGRLATGLTTTTNRNRLLAKNDLRRNLMPSIPGEYLSVEVFDKDQGRKKEYQERSNVKTTVQHELKNYIKRVRYLEKEVDRLKTINEINHKSEVKYVDNNYIDEHESKDKDGQDLYRTDEFVESEDIDHHLPRLHNHSHNLMYKKKNAINHPKKTIEAETSTKPKTSKKLTLLRTFETQVKNNALNKILAETTSKTVKKVVNTALNVPKEIKLNGIDKTETESKIYVPEENINEATSTPSYRRLVELFPSLFEGHALKEGFYPAHLWD